MQSRNYLSLKDLIAMGLPRCWLRVAKALGLETFMLVWRTLDESRDNPQVQCPPLDVPEWNYFKLRLCHRIIISLHACDTPTAQIQAKIRYLLGEDISEQQISSLKEIRTVEI